MTIDDVAAIAIQEMQKVDDEIQALKDKHMRQFEEAREEITYLSDREYKALCESIIQETAQVHAKRNRLKLNMAFKFMQAIEIARSD